jgi:hypothetical protein
MIGAASLGAGGLWIAPTLLALDTPAAAGSSTRFIDNGSLSSDSTVSLPLDTAITFYLLLAASTGNGGTPSTPGVITGPTGWTALNDNGNPASLTDHPRLWGWYRQGHLAGTSVSITKTTSDGTVFTSLASGAVILGFSGATQAFKGTVQKPLPVGATSTSVVAPGLALSPGDVGILVYFGMTRLQPGGWSTTPAGYTSQVTSVLNPGVCIAYYPPSGVAASVGAATAQTINSLENAGVHVAVW